VECPVYLDSERVAVGVAEVFNNMGSMIKERAIDRR
jgi:hypothetical protein